MVPKLKMAPFIIILMVFLTTRCTGILGAGWHDPAIPVCYRGNYVLQLLLSVELKKRSIFQLRTCFDFFLRKNNFESLFALSSIKVSGIFEALIKSSDYLSKANRERTRRICVLFHR